MNFGENTAGMGLVFFRWGNFVVKLNENPVEKVKSGVEMVVFEWRW